MAEIDFKGIIELKRGDIKIAWIHFSMDEYQITATDVDVSCHYRRKGYGTIIMGILMGIAESRHIPIYLYSLRTAVKFYEKLGFVRFRRYKKGWYKGKRVVIDNFNRRRTFDKQTDRTDMLWIPNNVHIVHICI